MEDRPKVNYRKAQGWACPRCGQMLEYIFKSDRKGHRHRYEQNIRTKEPLIPGYSVQVDKVVEVSRYETKIVGKEWLTVVKFYCRTCDKMLAEKQAVEHHFSEEELPYDYYVQPTDAELPGLLLELRRSGCTWGELKEVADHRVRQRRPRAPVQQTLDGGMSSAGSDGMTGNDYQKGIQ